MGTLKTKIIDGITPNFESTDSKDFIEILNKIAEAMGGVPNMGVFADITKVTQSNEMMADVSEQFISVTTRQHERPCRDLQPNSNETDPFQLELDFIIGKKGDTLPSCLASLLKKEDDYEEALRSAKKQSYKDEIEDEDEDDLDELDEDEDEDEDDDDLEEEEEEEEDDDDDETSISDDLRDVGKEIGATFKDIKNTFKLK